MPPLSTVPEEEESGSPGGKGCPASAPAAQPFARLGSPEAGPKVDGARGLQPPPFFAEVGLGKVTGRLSPVFVRGGLPVPKFLEDPKSLGALHAPPTASPHGPPKPPSFLLEGAGLGLGRHPRARSVEPPDVLQVCSARLPTLHRNRTGLRDGCESGGRSLKHSWVVGRRGRGEEIRICDLFPWTMLRTSGRRSQLTRCNRSTTALTCSKRRP